MICFLEHLMRMFFMLVLVMTLFFAEGGNDEITGGSGRNLLNGGEGRDFYYFNTADGDFDDTIIDSDGKGQLKIDGESLLGHFFDPKEGRGKCLDSEDWKL